MKIINQFTLAAIFAISFAACNNEQATETTYEEATATEAAATATIAGKTDPVCNMEYEASWTDYSVNGTDTTWFCSSACKDAYAANPQKYSK